MRPSVHLELVLLYHFGLLLCGKNWLTELLPQEDRRVTDAALLLIEARDLLRSVVNDTAGCIKRHRVGLVVNTAVASSVDCLERPDAI